MRLSKREKEREREKRSQLYRLRECQKSPITHQLNMAQAMWGSCAIESITRDSPALVGGCEDVSIWVNKLPSVRGRSDSRETPGRLQWSYPASENQPRSVAFLHLAFCNWFSAFGLLAKLPKSNVTCGLKVRKIQRVSVRSNGLSRRLSFG